MVGYNKHETLSPTEKGILGGVASCVTRFISQPLDVVKVRLQLQRNVGQKQQYKSVTHAFRTIYRTEGIRSLWTAHIAGQMLSMTSGVTQFFVYESLNKYTKENMPHKYTTIGNFICGSMAGVAYVIVSNPFDVIKTRMIVGQSYYSNMRKTAKIIYRREGIRALYHGLAPSLLQLVPYTGIQFALFEFVHNITFRAIIKPIFGGEINVEIAAIHGLFAGSVAGGMAKSMVYPLDLVKRRLQIQGVPQNKKLAMSSFITCNKIYNCLYISYKKEGIKGLFRGWWPSTIKAIAISACHFGIYESLCFYLREHKKEKTRR